MPEVSYQLNLSRSIYSAIFLLMLIAMSSNAKADEPNIPINAANVVPQEHESVTIDSIKRGLNPETQLLRTTFYCYYNKNAEGESNIDFSVPHATVNFVDQSAIVTFYGNETEYKGAIHQEPDTKQFTIIFSENNAFNYELEFDRHGQAYFSKDIEELAGCYQSGASHERALHQFLVNTPEPGEFLCAFESEGKETVNSVPFTLSDNNQYTLIRTSGAYTLQSNLTKDYGVIEFTSGSLAGSSAVYKETPNTGTQSILAEQNKVAYRCDKQRTPRPFKQYGKGSVEAPKPSSAPFNGVYMSVTSKSSGRHWIEFTADGFISTNGLPLEESHCLRVQPNGLPQCDQYVYNGDGKINLFKNYQNVDLPIQVSKNGALTIKGLGKYRPANILKNKQLIGKWVFRSAITHDEIDVSMCLLGYCSPTSADYRAYTFFADGQFKSTEKSQVWGNQYQSSYSSGSYTGTYELINGSKIQLTYQSDASDPAIYLHMEDDDTLVLDDFTFRRE